MPEDILSLAKLKGEGRPFWNGKAKTYPMNYLLYVGVMLTIIKMFIILFLLVRIGNILAILYSVLGQTEEERKAFFGGCKKGGHTVRLPPRALGCHKRCKSLSFCEM